jgi:hypothetical protein
MPHIFFSETIYSECMKFKHRTTGCFLYTCYFPVSVDTSWYREDMHALVSRWRMAVDVDGDYMEK